MADTEVSIIIVTYNSDWEKLKRTIKSAVCQQKINFEIIVSDDGSKNGLTEEVEKYFQDNHFSNYTVLRNAENVGTIRNIHTALQVANGEYVYAISPGDFIYDEYTMYEFYRFSKNNDAKICFGNYIRYTYENQKLQLYTDNYNPRCPERYAECLKNSQVAFFLIDDNICGVSYFRERAFFTDLINCVSQYAIYAEDGTTTALALMKNTDIRYFDRNIAWYEYGVGVSAAGNTEWLKKIKKDYDNTYAYLYQNYPKSSVLSVRKNQYIRLDFLLRYPVTAWRKNRLNKLPDRKIIITENDREKIIQLLEG